MHACSNITPRRWQACLSYTGQPWCTTPWVRCIDGKSQNLPLLQESDPQTYTKLVRALHVAILPKESRATACRHCGISIESLLVCHSPSLQQVGDISRQIGGRGKSRKHEATRRFGVPAPGRFCRCARLVFRHFIHAIRATAVHGRVL